MEKKTIQRRSRNKEPKKAIRIYLDNAEYEKIKSLSKNESKSMSNYICNQVSSEKYNDVDKELLKIFCEKRKKLASFKNRKN